MITQEEKIVDINIMNILEREILCFMPQRIKTVLKSADPKKLKNIEELRLRADKPLIIQKGFQDWFINLKGVVSDKSDNSFIVSKEDVISTLEMMSENSIYAYQEEIKNGYITLKGGHRVGIVGKVITDGTAVKNIKDISSLNIRISREVMGCSINIFKYLLNEKQEIYNTLIISPPQCGKTTILRDLSRVLSDGLNEMNFKGIKVGIVDERSEIAACFKGVPQNKVGVRTDVLDGCPKILGMAMLIRSMSPQVIITDEIGNCGDKDAIMMVLNAGVKIITTAHGYNISELESRQEVLSMLREKVFERYIVLSNRAGPGTLEEIIDGISMKTLFKRGNTNVT
jgi:stage III sporulation protein AA